MTTEVTALLVSHDGERWLGVVLDGLLAQTRPPDRVLAVDTGSVDGSPRLLRDRLGAGAVLDAPATAGFGEAVATGLAAAEAVEAVEDWVWLLHDDSAPAPDALERLLAVAGEHPSAHLLGPKLREWPSLRRLLEIGVSFSGTGARETGLEPGEYDQGQHDAVRDVLAVNTAGLLVRRGVLESLGLDHRLPVFGADVDLGWRAARAGHRTLVAPDAVVFHAEAAHRGLRRTPLTGPAHRGERAAALYTLLVNGAPSVLPLRLARLLVGSLLRVLALLLLRAPAEAVDELGALLTTYLRPWRVLAGRRERRRTARVGPGEVRHLLPAWWVPYRHGLDLLGDVATAVVHQAGDLGEVRRARSSVPASVSATSPAMNPALWVLALLVVVTAVAARGLVGGGQLLGGALLPAPHGALDWWRTYLASGHDLGAGSSAPAGPYLLPLAVAATVLLGHASLVVDVVFLLAVPLAALGAHRLLRELGCSRAASLWGAVAYGVLPVVTGAVQQGRLGTVAASLALPWLAHASLFLGPGRTPDRRRRAAWRTSLWLAVLVSFVPVAWVPAAVLALAAAASAGRDRVRMLGLVAVPLVASLVLLLPWSVATWSHGGSASVLLEAGLPVPDLARPVSWLDLVLGRPGAGAPVWMSLGVAVAAVAALLRTDTRPAVLRAWAVLVVALGTAAWLAALAPAPRPGGSGQPVWLGLPLVLAQAGGIVAAAIAGSGVRQRLTGAAFGWRQPFGVVVVAAAVLSPLVSAGWWVVTGSGGPLERAEPAGVPAYMGDDVAGDPLHGVLVMRGTRADGYTYTVLRGRALRLGDDTVAPTVAQQGRLTRSVERLAAAPVHADVRALARQGVAYVLAPAPADGALVDVLDGVSGLDRSSAVQARAAAWQVHGRVDGSDLAYPSDRARPWLLTVQAVAVLTVLVLCVPSRRRRR